MKLGSYTSSLSDWVQRKDIRSFDDPSLTSSPQALANRRSTALLAQLYHYYFGNYSSVCLSISYFCNLFLRVLHKQAAIHRYQSSGGRFSDSFFKFLLSSWTSELWNTFSPICNPSFFKSRISELVVTWIFLLFFPITASFDHKVSLTLYYTLCDKKCEFIGSKFEGIVETTFPNLSRPFYGDQLPPEIFWRIPDNACRRKIRK